MKTQKFWSIVIEPNWIGSGIWERNEGEIKLLSVGKSLNFDDHNMVEVADSSLSEAVSPLPEDEQEPSKTVFGVPASWVNDGKIEKEHLDKIKEICSKLSLSPIGFVVLSEAIAHSIKILEGSPLTAILLGVNNKFLDITLYKLGNMVGTVSVGRSDSLLEDIIEGLSRFGLKDPLPTRFIIYGGDSAELDDSKQDLVKTEWENMKERGLNFLHTPQFEIIEDQRKIVAASIAGASEMGEVTKVDLTNLSFKDTKTESTSVVTAMDDNVSATSDLTPEDIGFVIDQDIDEVEQRPQEDEYHKEEPKKAKFKFKIPSFNFKKEKKLEIKDKTDFKIKKMPRLPKGKMFLLIIVILLGLSAAGTFAAWWYLPKATVLIFVSPKRLEQEEAITLDESIDTPDLENLIFPAKSLSVEVSEQREKKTTGSIVVGDKASGIVQVRNGTSEAVQLKAGDLISGPNDLTFELTESASVSAAISPSEPGTVNISVEATDIGSEYNIAKDESFRVKSFSKSELDAVANANFSGGSSKKIVAVSQSDLDTLESELLSELKRKAIGELEDIAKGGRFISEAIETELIKKQFSASVGDEIETVGLTLVVEATGIAIEDSVVESLAQALLSNQVPEGYKLRKEQIEAQFELVDEVDDGIYDFDVRLIARLIPETNIDEIKNSIMGKYPPDAVDYLSSIAGFSKAEISLNPRFPGRFGIIPRIAKNIFIEIEAER